MFIKNDYLYNNNNNNLKLSPMRTYLILTFLIIGCPILKVKSQTCAVTDKKDPFTNVRIVETTDFKISGSSLLSTEDKGIYISFQIKNDSIFVCLNTAGKFMDTFSFENVLIKLSDNSIITLKDFQSPGSFRKGDYSFQKSYSKIDKLTLDKFTNFKITNIRIVTSGIRTTDGQGRSLIPGGKTLKGSTFDAELASNKGDKIIVLAKCISSYL